MSWALKYRRAHAYKTVVKAKDYNSQPIRTSEYEFLLLGDVKSMNGVYL